MTFFYKKIIQVFILLLLTGTWSFGQKNLVSDSTKVEMIESAVIAIFSEDKANFPQNDIDYFKLNVNGYYILLDENLRKLFRKTGRGTLFHLDTISNTTNILYAREAAFIREKVSEYYVVKHKIYSEKKIKIWLEYRYGDNIVEKYNSKFWVFKLKKENGVWKIKKYH